MYILKRSVSPYTSHDILLGCFRSREKAEVARGQYITQYKTDLKEDPWKGQAFRTINLDADVIILENISELRVEPSNKEVFVVSSFDEGFGQIIRTFQNVCGSLGLARRMAKDIDEANQNSFPHYCQIQKVVVDELLSDARTNPLIDII